MYVPHAGEDSLRQLPIDGPELALGTVQFGLDYGVANERGRTLYSEAAQILDLAVEAGVSLIDTAPGYGMAEPTLGTLEAEKRFRVVSKTPRFGTMDALAENPLAEAFKHTLENLRAERLYGLLIHHTDDLMGPHAAALFDAMLDLKAANLVEKVGISIYNGLDLDRFGNIEEIDIVQLPLSIFDQRACHDGTLDKLKANGIEVHLRSVFLQGIVLMNPDAVPPYFDPIRPLLRRLHDDAAAEGGNALRSALGFVQSLHQADAVIIGVDSPMQFRQISMAWAEPTTLAWDQYVGAPDDLLDPRCWPEFH